MILQDFPEWHGLEYGTDLCPDTVVFLYDAEGVLDRGIAGTGMVQHPEWDIWIRYRQKEQLAKKRNPRSGKMFLTAARHGQKRTFRCRSKVSSIVVEYFVDGSTA